MTTGRRIPELTQAKKARFLARFAEDGTITAAAKAAGIERHTHYAWMDADPEYAAGFREATKQAIEAMEAEARRRAVVGIEEPVYQGGRQVGAIRRFSDTLLIFLLKGAMPSKYRERIDVTMDVSSEVRKMAAELGLDEAAILAEAEAIVSGR